LLRWRGYLSQWNLLDYPAIILPTGIHVGFGDSVDTSYQPVNELDKENHEMYSPEVFEGMPVCFQLVGRSIFEEKLLDVARAVVQAIQA
jgi:amidase